MGSRRLPEPSPKPINGDPAFVLMVQLLSGLWKEEHLCPTLPGDTMCREGKKLLQRLVNAKKYSADSRQYKKAATEFVSHFEGEKELEALAND